MKTIWKFEIELTDNQNVMMPMEAKILTVQIQHGKVCVWAIVDPEQPLERRYFYLRGTGHPSDGMDEMQYVGTVQDRQGFLIWHIFTEKE